MTFSKFLASKHDAAKTLVNKLLQRYSYVSLLGTHVTGTNVAVMTSLQSVSDTNERQCGFVVKVFTGKNYAEYSFNNLDVNHLDELEEEIVKGITISEGVTAEVVKTTTIDDTPLVKTFYRPVEGKIPSIEELMQRLNKIKDKAHKYDSRIIQVRIMYGFYEVSKMFISQNRDLCQNFAWTNVYLFPVAREGSNIKSAYTVAGYNNPMKCLDEIEKKVDSQCQLCIDLLKSTFIEPGVYDIICEPSITGLIAHEAFGHGVEMDMFVKNRAMAKNYINKYVASKLVNMHDGASATLSAASYFFDDDGVLASDTLIIKDGILQTGISDILSASELGTKPTGNGRRETYKRKAYTRMTNTFFSAGTDKVEDMIKSIKHGYLLCDTNNGMEDPKNWGIQCTCEYGREIVDGKFTGKIVSPVCMSGYVPNLLGSISMVSEEVVVTGAGHCGKGHKEWVPVSDGGPYIKARCKLG